METTKDTWLKALDKATKARHYETIRDVCVKLADAILDLADAQVEADNDKARIERARSLLHEWIGSGKAPALPPADLLFAIGIVLDTVEMPGSDTGLGTEIFAQLCQLGLTGSESIDATPFAFSHQLRSPCGSRRPDPRPCCCSYYRGCRSRWR